MIQVKNYSGGSGSGGGFVLISIAVHEMLNPQLRLKTWDDQNKWFDTVKFGLLTVTHLNFSTFPHFSLFLHLSALQKVQA